MAFSKQRLDTSACWPRARSARRRRSEQGRGQGRGDAAGAGAGIRPVGRFRLSRVRDPERSLRTISVAYVISYPQ